MDPAIEAALTPVIAGLIILPVIIAYNRNRRQRRAIAILSLCFGWTGIGWAIALIWSLIEDRN